MKFGSSDIWPKVATSKVIRNTLVKGFLLFTFSLTFTEFRFHLLSLTFTWLKLVVRWVKTISSNSFFVWDAFWLNKKMLLVSYLGICSIILWLIFSLWHFKKSNFKTRRRMWFRHERDSSKLPFSNRFKSLRFENQNQTDTTDIEQHWDDRVYQDQKNILNRSRPWSWSRAEAR